MSAFSSGAEFQRAKFVEKCMSFKFDKNSLIRPSKEMRNKFGVNFADKSNSIQASTF